MKVFSVDVRERPQPQIPLISVVSIKLEVREYVRSLQLVCILETIAEPERPVVMKIIPQEHVGRRRFFHDSFQGGVRLEYRHDHQPARV